MNETQLTCSCCNTELLPDEHVAVCSDCGCVLHERCWQNNCRCTTFGCAGKPTAVIRASLLSLDRNAVELHRSHSGNGSAIGKTCPFCQSPIKPGADHVSCPECGIPHHSECWNSNDGCTTFGCSGRTPDHRGNQAAVSTEEQPEPHVTADPGNGSEPTASLRSNRGDATDRGTSVTEEAIRRRPRGLQVFPFFAVIAVVGVVAAIVLPVVGRAKAADRRSTCLNNLKQCAQALVMYCDDYDGKPPSPDVGGVTRQEFAAQFCVGRSMVNAQGTGSTPLTGQRMTWCQMLYDHMRTQDIVWCPSDPMDHNSISSASCFPGCTGPVVSYWYMLYMDQAFAAVYADQTASDASKEPDYIAFYEHANWHYSGQNSSSGREDVNVNASFIDTHVEMVRLPASSTEWYSFPHTDAARGESHKPVASGTKDTGPTEVGTKAVAKTENKDNGRWPWTSERPVDESDIASISASDRDIMRNEIYARHGWLFQRQDLQTYFGQQPWYHAGGPASDRDRVNRRIGVQLSKLERANAEKIRDYQKAHGENQ